MDETRIGDATYSPEDNKLRLYAFARLDADEYARAKAAGFRWHPKQELFCAPMWTPEREDLLLEWCGSIEDEDSSVADRAAERAERFEGYRENRQRDADAAYDAVSRLADSIPLGQPILVGHHSEKRARRDAKRIENGMRKAVNQWETAKYWKSRIAGVLAHADYKARPDVRLRRIKKLDADRRRQVRRFTPNPKAGKVLQTPWYCPVCGEYACKVHPEAEVKVPHVWVGHSRGGTWVEESRLPDIERSAARWIAHFDNRRAYEVALLGYDPADQPKPKRPKPPPLLNYRAPDGITYENEYHRGEMIRLGQVEMTRAEYAKVYQDYKGTRFPVGSPTPHRVRIVIQRRTWSCVFLTDSKEHANPYETAGGSSDPGNFDVTKTPAKPDPSEALFSGVLGGEGVSYADMRREKHGDYLSCGFLSFRTLELDIRDECPADLRPLIEADAARIQAMRGQDYQISTSGQTRRLGWGLKDEPKPEAAPAPAGMLFDTEGGSK